ncbi:ABC transporter permease [Paenibacillus lignilyticus]|uniref:Sugar ABC transporter permease n=1 Tax=Paenibacillus lignilyticus TaxID=1172615 RepID=A0ABS5CBT2_9BACL|nr:ABC transporter permease subunit [Paenibacillus lignilyticus]MBP3962608.1 sugar ABC transporter permease [Paenibacillus lignilyticus]
MKQAAGTEIHLERNRSRLLVKNKSLWRQLVQNFELFTLSLPGVLFLFIFAYIPMFGIIIAFKNYRFDKGILGSEWIGFKNFEFLFASDTAWRITRNTILYSSGYMLIGTFTALLLAIFMNELTKKWIKVHQTIIFLPHFVSWVVAGYLVIAFLDHNAGFLNQMLESIGWRPHKWYFESAPWPYILNLANLWKGIGFGTLIYYAGIVGINPEYYEAARIDGASRTQMAVKITLPMLSSLITILLILSIGNMFRGDFGLHYFIPNDSKFALPTTDIIDTYVVRALRSLGDIGMSSAAGVYQSVVGFILVVLANWIVRRINKDNSLF